MTRFKTFIFNGLMITIVSILIRTVSVSFNVYISNQIGAVAMGLFTLISTVYGFAITVATSGIGLATTKLVAEAMGAPEKSDLRSHFQYWKRRAFIPFFIGNRKLVTPRFKNGSFLKGLGFYATSHCPILCI